jgi:hypothetical protein
MEDMKNVGTNGSLGTSVKIPVSKLTKGLAWRIATTMRREYFRGLVSHVPRTAALTAA